MDETVVSKALPSLLLALIIDPSLEEVEFPSSLMAVLWPPICDYLIVIRMGIIKIVKYNMDSFKN